MPTPTLEELLGKGYFPEVLPPVFNTRHYGEVLSDDSTRPSEFEFVSNRRSFKPTSKCVQYNQARQGSLRRRFSIPNPLHFYRIGKTVHENWMEIRKRSHASKLSLTKPVLSDGRRCFSPNTRFVDRPLKRARVRSLARFVLRADIAQFFPSIYTHSIGWAFHSKAKCKADRSNNLLGNLIDSHIRNMQDGQTSGIPIGQDISRIIAEVILGRVDEEICNKHKKVNGIRCIDDYEFGFRNAGDAEKLLTTLRQELEFYELNLNPLKSGISRLPQYLIDRWDSELRNHLFRRAVAIEDEDDHELMDDGHYWGEGLNNQALLNFFNKAIELQRQFPDEGVLRFALRRLRDMKIHEDAWPLYQDFIFQSAMIDSGTTKHVVFNLLKAKYADERTIDEKRLTELFSILISENVKFAHHSEVAHSLWGTLLFDLELPRQITKAINLIADSATGCLALHCLDQGRFRGNPKFDLLRGHIQSKEIYGENWLFLYEAAAHSWLNSQAHDSEIRNDPCLGYLLDKGVSFYNEESLEEMKQALTQRSEDDDWSEDLEDEDGSDVDDDFGFWYLSNDKD